MNHSTVVEEKPVVNGAGDRSKRTAPARTGLLTRLFGLVLLSILPALLVQTYNEIELRKSREAEIRENALRARQIRGGRTRPDRR